MEPAIYISYVNGMNFLSVIERLIKYKTGVYLQNLNKDLFYKVITAITRVCNNYGYNIGTIYIYIEFKL